jgi:acetyltransferase-like isoleucine patch superfamily enzyme
MRFLYLVYRRVLSSMVGKALFKKCGPIMFMGDYQVCGGKYITVGSLSAGKDFRIEALIELNIQNPKIVMGNNVSFGNHIHIGCVNSISIGNNVLCGSNIYITDHDHGDYSYSEVEQCAPETPPAMREIYSSPVRIGDNVFIGEYVQILKGVTIGEGSVIGSGSVVVKSLPKQCIAVGVPARPVKIYDDSLKQWVRFEEK